MLTVPSRRDDFYLPSGSVMRQKNHCTVPSHPVEKIHTHRPLPSHPGNHNAQYFTVPSRPVLSFSPAKHVKTVPSRPVSNCASHETPWKLSNRCTNGRIILLTPSIHAAHIQSTPSTWSANGQNAASTCSTRSTDRTLKYLEVQGVCTASIEPRNTACPEVSAVLNLEILRALAVFRSTQA